MNKETIASELIKVAKDLIGADVKEILNELDYFQVEMAEGSRNGLPTLDGKKFKNVRDLEKAVERFSYPDGGYDKVFIDLKMKDGPDLHFKYYHSKKDPSLSRQFDNHVKKNFKKVASSRVAGSAIAKLVELNDMVNAPYDEAEVGKFKDRDAEYLKIKRPLAKELLGEYISHLKRNPVKDPASVFAGSLLHEIEEGIARKYTGKTFPTIGTLLYQIAPRSKGISGKTLLKNAYNKLYGKGVFEELLKNNKRISSAKTADDLELFEPEVEDPNFIAKVRALRSRLSQLTKLKNKKLSTFGIGIIRGRNTVEELVDVLNGIVGGGVAASSNRIAAKFKLGRVVTTSGVADKMEEDSSFKRFVDKSFREYTRGDWGDTDREDAEMNDEAVESGDRIMGVYKSGSDKIWIITEWNRSVTTILFPSEY